MGNAPSHSLFPNPVPLCTRSIPLPRRPPPARSAHPNAAAHLSEPFKPGSAFHLPPGGGCAYQRYGIHQQLSKCPKNVLAAYARSLRTQHATRPTQKECKMRRSRIDSHGSTSWKCTAFRRALELPSNSYWLIELVPFERPQSTWSRPVRRKVGEIRKGCHRQLWACGGEEERRRGGGGGEQQRLLHGAHRWGSLHTPKAIDIDRPELGLAGRESRSVTES